MCGICGLYDLERGRPAARSTIVAMARAIAHRGPDDEGQHIDGDCGIAMRRLSIIDLAGGHQPISNAEGTLTVVCGSWALANTAPGGPYHWTTPVLPGVAASWSAARLPSRPQLILILLLGW